MKKRQAKEAMEIEKKGMPLVVGPNGGTAEPIIENMEVYGAEMPNTK